MSAVECKYALASAGEVTIGHLGFPQRCKGFLIQGKAIKILLDRLQSRKDGTGDFLSPTAGHLPNA